MQIRDFLGLSQDYTSNPCIFEVESLGYFRMSLRDIPKIEMVFHDSVSEKLLYLIPRDG
jgi:hypothetical protein